MKTKYKVEKEHYGIVSGKKHVHGRVIDRESGKVVLYLGCSLPRGHICTATSTSPCRKTTTYWTEERFEKELEK